MTRDRHRSLVLAALLGAAALAACDKNAVQDITGPFPTARIKFFNFGVGAPAVNFYANEAKMTAVRSDTGKESTSGVAYGGVGAGGVYVAIAPGQYTLTGRISALVDKDLPIATASAAIGDGKFYSFYMSGLYDATAKTVDAFVVEDGFVIPSDYSLAYVRFVHTISNANPLTLYAVNTTTHDTLAVGGVVAYKGAGAFTALPSGVYDLGARYTDSTSNAISRTAVSLVGGRIYTIAARGDITVTSSTATTRPMLDNTANR